MNSTESIGVCSLDPDSMTHSDGSLSPSNDPKHHAIVENNYSSSAYTLKSTSLILSNGSSSPVSKVGNPELRLEQYGTDELDRSTGLRYDKEERASEKQSEGLKNRIEPGTNSNLDPGHLPSYLGISCAISGYSGYSRYCHSRDNSPARVNSVTNSKFSIASSKSPNTAMNQNSTFLTNGTTRSKTDSYICNKYFGDTTSSQPKTEAQRNYVSSQNITLRQMSPVGYSNGINGRHALIGNTYEREWETRRFEEMVQNQQGGVEIPSIGSISEGPKSLVHQRIESLFGQPASKVVQGGGVRVSRPKSRAPVDSLRSPSCPPQAFRPSSRSPPVFRHITKDFKEQLRNATVPTKNAPLKPQLSPNKQLAPLIKSKEPISKGQELLSPVTAFSNGFSPKHTLRATSEPKVFPKAVLSLSPTQIEVPAIETPTSIGDGHFYIVKIDAATKDIQRQIKEVEEDSKLGDVPEEALGKLLSAAGKANLLIAQKFAQFRQLCEKNITPDPAEPFPTTNEDLAGFWDMVLLQVDNVNDTFSSLRQLKARDWKEETVPYARSKNQTKNQPKRNTRASKSNPTTPEHSKKATELAKARDEQRKKFMEAKKRGKQQPKTSEEAEIAIFVPDPATK